MLILNVYSISKCENNYCTTFSAAFVHTLYKLKSYHISLVSIKCIHLVYFLIEKVSAPFFIMNKVLTRIIFGFDIIGISEHKIKKGSTPQTILIYHDVVSLNFS